MPKVLASWWSWIEHRPVEYFDYLFALARHLFPFKGSFIRRRWVGDVPLAGAKRVAVFTHFDYKGVVHDYVIFFVRKLKEAGYAVIFVSNARKLTHKEVAKIIPYVSVALHRRNVGYDFGAYKDGIALIDRPEDLDSLIITNDSVYGPLQDISDFILAADPEQADIWGITDSWDRFFHLQSYFLLFHQSALQSTAFAKFWRRVRYFRCKRWVIDYYELGLSRYFLRNGLRCKALFPYRTLMARVSEAIERTGILTDKEALPARREYVDFLFRHITGGAPLNQTHYFWDFLIGKLKCPFLKRDLLQKSPVGIPFLQHWEGVVRSASDYDPELIVRHLQITMKNRVY